MLDATRRCKKKLQVNDLQHRYGADGASRHESFNPPLNLNRNTNDEFSR